MLNPQTDKLILDPACGSGGFLLNSMDFIREYAQKEYEDVIEAYRVWHDFAKDNVYGIEINDQIARVCKMNMIIHDDGHSNIISVDTLQEIDKTQKIHKGFKKNNFDLILTNPPFGATVKLSEKPYLENYSLGKGKKTQKTEILFIERCLDFLKPGIGTMAIVMPDGILTNSSLQYVRNYIMQSTQILAVVSLPQFAFSHFGAVVKSSLLFLRKIDVGEDLGNYPIFMAIAEHIGYDSTGRKDPINDLDKIYKEYQTFLKDPHNYEGC
jgi:type I restriction enzyme M protein